MDTFLWILQWILALVFLMAGAMKLFQSYEQLAADERMGWVTKVGPTVVKVAGVTEVLGAVGLVLPGLVDIAHFLTPVAAFGLALQMLIAAGWVHVPRKETQMVVINLILAGLALVVGIGRLIVPLG